MPDLAPFPELLTRLAEVRGLDLPARTDAEPGSARLRSLAPILGLHVSDLFVIAGRPVPDDLAPHHTTRTARIGSLPWTLTYVPGAVPELRELVRSLPTQPHPGEPVEPRPWESYPDTAAALVIRLLHNRNLDWNGIVRFLYGVGHGPMLSPATVRAIAADRLPLEPDLLAGLGVMLDLTPADLMALTGVDVSAAQVKVHREARVVAELIWDARRLTGDQLQTVNDHARSLSLDYKAGR
ncbi:hypothetical protein KOI35_37190 [Actinoplanes bogorensis]|uniref:XRE family transcriptional regulator n=1 Tax=Paractinoplanes bogorensis TaxID=1610840 RepID=A0ABS5Z0E0_9ACTN|nr:hypothetical protein [Actinoplanes bogorensis]MBU2669164.1 hypothetical protein [Actinoplanes bogorensis]